MWRHAIFVARPRRSVLFSIALLTCALLSAPVFAQGEQKLTLGFAGGGTVDGGGPLTIEFQIANQTILAGCVGSCVSPAAASFGPALIELTPNTVYDCKFTILTGQETSHQGTALRIYTIGPGLPPYPLCDYVLYCDGVSSSDWLSANSVTSQSFTLELRGPTNPPPVVSWVVKNSDGKEVAPNPVQGRYRMPADGASKAFPTFINPCAFAPAYSFLGDALGCIMNGGGVITAGTNVGTIRVRAEVQCGTNCLTQETLIELTDCSSCTSGTCADIGGPSFDLGSLDARFGLGWSKVGGTAGSLRLHAAVPGTNLTSPLSLKYSFVRPDVDEIRDGTGAGQVKTLQGLANIVISNSASYRIEFYDPTNVLSWTNGAYPLANGPWRVFTVQNVSGDTNRLRIADSFGDVTDYSWITNGWELSSGNGLRVETKTNEWSGGGDFHTETTWVKGPNGNVASQSSRTFQKVFYGSTTFSNDLFVTNWFATERLVAEVTGDGLAARTNLYHYATNFSLAFLPGPVNLANLVLQQVTRGDGS